MNNLVILKNNDCFTNSLVISKGTKNKHRSIQRLIEKYKNVFEKFGKVRFEITPSGKTKQNLTVYLLNEQQATFLITLLKNTDIVIDFKINLVKEFYYMRALLMEKQTSVWIETREMGKLTRRAETDTIKELIEYAKKQGSTNADRLYMIYSKLAKRMAGINSRDLANVMELNNLSLIENIILNVIRTGMSASKFYKDIYRDSKKALETFNKVAFL